VHIKKGDLVEVIAGKELGKRGKVLRVFPARQRAVVERLNMIKRHTRPSPQNQQGGIVEKEGTIHISNLLPVCNTCNRGVRVGYKFTPEGKKVRVCRKCGAEI